MILTNYNPSNPNPPTDNIQMGNTFYHYPNPDFQGQHWIWLTKHLFEDLNKYIIIIAFYFFFIFFKYTYIYYFLVYCMKIRWENCKRFNYMIQFLKLSSMN
jgi:hypothetical protein